jgi:hypothetical protein
VRTVAANDLITKAPGPSSAARGRGDIRLLSLCDRRRQGLSREAFKYYVVSPSAGENTLWGQGLTSSRDDGTGVAYPFISGSKCRTR